MAGGKIILISANTHKIPYPVYPLGISYLKTYLERTAPQWQVEMLDCNVDTKETIGAALKDEPLMVGISLRNADGANSLDRGDFLEEYRRLTDFVRATCSAPIVLGGAAFSMFPQKFMEALDADFGITGEGEESLRRLVESLAEGVIDKSIEGLVWRNGEGICANGRSCYLQKLEVEFDSRLVDYYWLNSGMLNIQTQRGCPYNCIYCSYPIIEGRSVRALEAEAVVESIVRLKREKGVDYFFFTDSVFNIEREYNVRFAEALIRAGVKISWGAYFAPRGIDNETMSLFAHSGLSHIEFGTESMSDECLEKYGKAFSVSDIMATSKTALDNNVFYAHFLIFGGYGETSKTVRETIENSQKIRHSVFFPYIGMRIYPHTGLQNVALREGVITAEDDLFAPQYYIADDFDLGKTREMANETGKAWIFPDDPMSSLMDEMRLRRRKKGPLWEYLRKP